MKNLKLAILLVLALAGLSSPLNANDLDFCVGARYLGENDWPEVNAQAQLGLNLHIKPTAWPIGLVGGYSLSSVRQNHALALNPMYGLNTYEIEGRTNEARLGLRYDLDAGQQNQLYVKGGLSLVMAMQKYTTVTALEASSRDRAPGVWLGLGATHRLTEHFNLGLEAGYGWSRARLWHSNIDAGGFELGCLAGYHW